MKPLAKIYQFIWSRLLPKTGQTTMYREGDDGQTEYGWFNNSNKTRFITKTINGDDVVIDKATRLMWARDGNAAGCYNHNVLQWINAISYAAGLTFAGYSDWRLPNAAEAFSTKNFELGSPTIHPVFTNTDTSYYSTSTTNKNNTTYQDTIYYGGTTTMPRVLKSTWIHLRCVRFI